ncbi:hypothetical protein GW930_00190 [Candidatus Saccharibacteria bacterium]|nr:hypothetical protein [Candidatus Saccharibacteria bacterium]
MTLFQYLQLQPVDSQDDGSVSDLDQYEEDETLDLTQDIDEETLDEEWERVLKDMHSDPSGQAPIASADDDKN